MKGLTEKQRQIYQFIVSFQQDHGYPPSVREIGEHMGLKSPSTVHFHLKGLEEAGIITKAEGKTRAITVAGGFPAPSQSGRLPCAELCWGQLSIVCYEGILQAFHPQQLHRTYHLIQSLQSPYVPCRSHRTLNFFSFV